MAQSARISRCSRLRPLRKECSARSRRKAGRDSVFMGLCAGRAELPPGETPKAVFRAGKLVETGIGLICKRGHAVASPILPFGSRFWPQGGGNRRKSVQLLGRQTQNECSWHSV